MMHIHLNLFYCAHTCIISVLYVYTKYITGFLFTVAGQNIMNLSWEEIRASKESMFQIVDVTIITND